MRTLQLRGGWFVERRHSGRRGECFAWFGLLYVIEKGCATRSGRVSRAERLGRFAGVRCDDVRTRLTFFATGLEGLDDGMVTF